MKLLRRLTFIVPIVLLVASLIGSYLTQGSMANLPFLLKGGGGSRTGNDLVDQRSWQTIETLTPLAVSAEEKRLVRELQRLADHEVDQAFAQALREASMTTRTPTGNALKLQDKITGLQSVIKEDQAKIDALNAAAKGPTPPTSDEIDAAKAQLQLDSDDLEDSTEFMARIMGDKRGDIQQELTTRQAAMKKFNTQYESADAPSAVQSVKRYATLFGRVSAWFDQRSRMDSITQAQQQALHEADALSARHDAIDKQLAADTTGVSGLSGKARVTQLDKLHSMAQVRSILEDRMMTQKQLAVVYGRWHDQVDRQHAIVLHLMLQSVAFIAFILLCSALLTAFTRKMLERLRIERRTLMTLRTVVMLAIQIITLLVVLLAIFGAPEELPTIIGFLTAGLTVVFQGFIVSFFGWFILMGKNGMRVGDWVEISGIGGEVVELGLFRTTLLETGNWTDNGHPTGRRVTFMNSFAINSQFFNFSTSGQWLWDEIHVNIPAGPHTYQLIDTIHDTVQSEIAEDVRQANTEWQRATGNHDIGHFSVEPSVDLRPASSGVDVIVRYMTRATTRFATRNRIYQTVIDLMRKQEEITALESGAKP